MATFQDNAFRWASSVGGCYKEPDGLYYPMFALEYEIAYKTLGNEIYGNHPCQEIYPFRGNAAFMGKSWDQFTLSREELFNTSRDCSALHQSFDYVGGMSFYQQPDLTVAESENPDPLVKKLPCLYNVPFCDFTNPLVYNGCKKYRDDMASADPNGSNIGDWEYGDCMESELLWYCAQTLGIYRQQFYIGNVYHNYKREMSAFQWHISSLQPSGDTCYTTNTL